MSIGILKKIKKIFTARGSTENIDKLSKQKRANMV
jgi:hypothetical protein